MDDTTPHKQQLKINAHGPTDIRGAAIDIIIPKDAYDDLVEALEDRLASVRNGAVDARNTGQLKREQALAHALTRLSKASPTESYKTLDDGALTTNLHVPQKLTDPLKQELAMIADTDVPSSGQRGLLGEAEEIAQLFTEALEAASTDS